MSAASRMWARNEPKNIAHLASGSYFSGRVSFTGRLGSDGWNLAVVDLQGAVHEWQVKMLAVLEKVIGIGNAPQVFSPTTRASRRLVP